VTEDGVNSATSQARQGTVLRARANGLAARIHSGPSEEASRTRRCLPVLAASHPSPLDVLQVLARVARPNLPPLDARQRPPRLPAAGAPS